MKTKEFENWLKPVEQLSRSQRTKLQESVSENIRVDEAITLIEQNLKNILACPYCKGTEFYRWGKASKLQRYRCRQCNRTFNALTGTPRARLRHKDKWLKFEETMIDGLSLRKSASVCGIATNTSFKWRHRFTKIPKTEQSEKIDNIVETDETHLSQSFKEQPHLPKSPR